MSEDKERYRKLIDIFHQHDIGKYVELPQIAVMGDTSTGKSSLLSALSTGIEFPSNTDITTRCPCRLRLEKSIDKCYAKISIKWDDSKAVEKKKDWKAKTIIDWNQGENSKEVTSIIKEAQEYILSRYGDDKAGVSADIIEIEVYSKDCVDLTIIDLPGFVRTVSKNEKQELISEIRSLINDYLKNDRCIILAVVPANVDFHNSQILADAKAVDPHTKRTIPVITKPDTIGEGSENSVHQLLLGEMADFALGFHMVKCRGQKELDDGITLKQSLEKEESFFNETEPWRNEPNKSLFGVAHLSDKLAALQVNMIEDSMSSIISEITKEKQKALEDLKKLGPEAADVFQMRNIFDRLKDDLITCMKSIYDGRGDINEKLSKALLNDEGYSWCSMLKNENSILRDSILKEKLNNIIEQIKVGRKVIVTTDDAYEFEGTVAFVDIGEDGNEIAYIDPSNKIDESKCFKADIKAALGGKVPSVCVGNSYQGIENNPSVYYKVITIETYRPYIAFDFSSIYVSNVWLKEEIKKQKNQDLDCFLSCQVFKQIIHKLIADDCAPLCEAFMKTSHDMLLKLCENAVNIIFPDNWPRLKTLVLQLVTELAQQCYSTSGLKEKLNQEETPYSQNDYLYETIKKKRNEKLKNKILSVLGNFGDPTAVQEAVKALFEQNERMSIDDHNAAEMEIILSAYGKVAAKG